MESALLEVDEGWEVWKDDLLHSVSSVYERYPVP
jgi:hypothetical protein